MIRLAVIGDPIEHSLSPAVHGAALDRLGVEYEYKKVHVRPEELGEFVKTAKREGLDGFNLTMPHKVNILPYLSRIDDEARYYSAVNTVCIRNGELHGFNTDGIGYELALGRMGKKFSGSRLVVLGAGGAGGPAAGTGTDRRVWQPVRTGLSFRGTRNTEPAGRSRSRRAASRAFSGLPCTGGWIWISVP